GVAWMAAFTGGFAHLWKYEGAAGASATAPMNLPAGTSIEQKKGLPTLVMLLHPKCPCSRASVEELSRLMTRCHGKLSATVLMVQPADVPAGWEKTDLWQSAARIPGVVVTSDPRGVDTERFGAST